MQKSVIFSVFFCFFFLVIHAQDHATRSMKKEMKAYNKKLKSGNQAKIGESEFSKAPKKPFLQRIGIVKVNSLIPNFFESANRQDKKTARRMKKNYRKAKKRMRKNFSNIQRLYPKENQIVIREV